jgi:hypothetical protein
MGLDWRWGFETSDCRSAQRRTGAGGLRSHRRCGRRRGAANCRPSRWSVLMSMQKAAR